MVRSPNLLVARRLLAGCLTLTLGLPSPAFALRTRPPAEVAGTTTGLEEALEFRAAGLEEPFRLVKVTREYAQQHAEALAAIEVGESVWEREGRWGPERFPMETRLATGTPLKDLWALSFAVEDPPGTPVGYIYTTNGHPDYPVATQYPGAFISRLAVHPAVQGRQLGPTLILAVARAALARGIGPSMTLETASENAQAQHVYESLGFEPAGERWDTAKQMFFVAYQALLERVIQRAEALLTRPTPGLEEREVVAAWAAARPVIEHVAAPADAPILLFEDPAIFDLVPLAVLKGATVAVVSKSSNPVAADLRALLDRLPNPKGLYAVGADVPTLLSQHPEAPRIPIANRVQLLVRLGFGTDTLPPAVTQALEATSRYLQAVGRSLDLAA